MTQYLQTKTDIFAAAMSHAGISDITSYWGEGYWGYSYSSLASANALKLLGKPTAFVQVEGENHHILDYDKRILWNNTIYAWFAKWLKDQPEWWDALYPPKSL